MKQSLLFIVYTLQVGCFISLILLLLPWAAASAQIRNASDTERKYKLDIDSKVKNNKLIPYTTSGSSVVTFVGELE